MRIIGAIHIQNILAGSVVVKNTTRSRMSNVPLSLTYNKEMKGTFKYLHVLLKLRYFGGIHVKSGWMSEFDD